jgi:hypothetical protein
MWCKVSTALLCSLVDQGMTSGQIQREMTVQGYPLTRNAVIGKLHRIGLKTHRLPSVKKPPEPKKPAGQGQFGWPRWSGEPEEVPVKHRERLHLSYDKPVGIHALNHRTCRWPLWGLADKHEQRLYCGAPTAKRPYCEQHRTIAGRLYTQSASTREPKRPFITRA